MSKKETIEDRVKALSEREEKIKRQLDSDSDEVKGKVMQVGKIALVAGGVALIGYWIFNVFFHDDDYEEEEEKPKKKKKRSRHPEGVTSRITALLLPYLNKVLDGILEDEEWDQKKKEVEGKEKEED